MSLTTASLNVSLTARSENASDLATPYDALSLSATLSLLAGTGAVQADLIFHDRRTVAQGTPDDIDLNVGPVSPLGEAQTFARIKMVVVKNNSTQNSIKVGAGSAPIATIFTSDGEVIIPPGGVFALGCTGQVGFVVTATTGDVLRVTHNGGVGTPDITYDIAIVGVSV